MNDLLKIFLLSCVFLSTLIAFDFTCYVPPQPKPRRFPPRQSVSSVCAALHPGPAIRAGVRLAGVSQTVLREL